MNPSSSAAWLPALTTLVTLWLIRPLSRATLESVIVSASSIAAWLPACPVLSYMSPSIRSSTGYPTFPVASVSGCMGKGAGAGSSQSTGAGAGSSQRPGAGSSQRSGAGRGGQRTGAGSGQGQGAGTGARVPTTPYHPCTPPPLPWVPTPPPPHGRWSHARRHAAATLSASLWGSVAPRPRTIILVLRQRVLQALVGRGGRVPNQVLHACLQRPNPDPRLSSGPHPHRGTAGALLKSLKLSVN